eukprot:480431-Hanusia_phi.AAC.1
MRVDIEELHESGRGAQRGLMATMHAISETAHVIGERRARESTTDLTKKLRTSASASNTSRARTSREDPKYLQDQTGIRRMVPITLAARPQSYGNAILVNVTLVDDSKSLMSRSDPQSQLSPAPPCGCKCEPGRGAVVPASGPLSSTPGSSRRRSRASGGG